MSEVFRSYINTVRREFADKALDLESVGDDPFAFFETWFDEAVGVEALDPNAMSIATVQDDGQPSVRVVYMRDIGPEGLVFYTNFNSKKGKNRPDHLQAPGRIWGPVSFHRPGNGSSNNLCRRKTVIYPERPGNIYRL